MTGTPRGVEIIGVGLHPFGRWGDKTAPEMGVDAVRAALVDASFGPGERPFQARVRRTEATARGSPTRGTSRTSSGDASWIRFGFGSR